MGQTESADDPVHSCARGKARGRVGCKPGATVWVHAPCSGLARPAHALGAGCQLCRAGGRAAHADAGALCALTTPGPHPRAGAAALMADVYADHKDEDNFLYITYSGENTFG